MLTADTLDDCLYKLSIKDIISYIKNEDALFILINIYLFFEYIRPQTLYPSIDILPWARSVLIVTLITYLLRNSFNHVQNTVNTILMTFFAVILLSSIFALSPSVAFAKLPEFISWMIIYFLIVNIVNTENRFLIFMLFFLLYNFKMSQFSFLNWASSGFSFHKVGSGGGPGWFHNSGEFGIEMCIFLSLSACFFMALKNYWTKWKKLFFFLFPFTAITGTISSSSRGAVVGAGAVLFFAILKGKQKVKVLLVFTVIAALAYNFIPPEQIARFQSVGEDNTSVSRLVLWQRGLELLSQFPYLGVGYNNWLIAQERIFGLFNQQVCHNIFIQCASELGYIGLSVFIMLIIFTFVNNYRTRQLVTANGGSRFVIIMSHSLDGALVGYLVSGFFVTVLYYPYFWINLAMTVALNGIVKNNNYSTQQMH